MTVTRMRKPKGPPGPPAECPPAGSLALAVVVLFGVWPIQGGDLLEHLTVGRWVWQHAAVPREDVFQMGANRCFSRDSRTCITWCPINGVRSMPAPVGWRSKAGDYQLETGFLTSTSSPQEAFDKR
jgi:hypothetical protein